MRYDVDDASNGDGLRSFDRLSDDALELRLRKLLAAGARTEALVVAHLAEVEHRRLHARGGYRSLFEYCLVALGFSEFEAVSRISAARAMRNFPLAFELLERGELHLSGLHLLRRHLTPENHVELLGAARLKSKREIERLIAARFPRPDVAANIAPLTVTEPLSRGRYRLELTIDEDFKDKLERACDRLSHVLPSRDFAVVLERALDALLAQLEKGRFGKPKMDAGRSHAREPDVEIRLEGSAGARAHEQEAASVDAGAAEERRPLAPADVAADAGLADAASDAVFADAAPANGIVDVGEAESRRRVASLRKIGGATRSHIPWRVARAVAERDEHRCTYVSTAGRRCGARGFLQLHHEQPWAHGGPDTIDNLRLLCAEHNALLAEQDFGRQVVARAKERSREQRGTSEKVATQGLAPQPSLASDAERVLLEGTTQVPIPDKVA